MNTASIERTTSGFEDKIPDFERLLGAAAWRRLPLAVRDRFRSNTHATVVTYEGRAHVHASIFGRLLAHACRLIGTPVAPYVGEDVRMIVRVVPTMDGIVWERHYEFSNSKTCVVSSTKQLDRGGLVEKLGAGLNMRLHLFERDGALHFVSERYFFRLGTLRFDLPDWFLPGGTHVIHEDLGAGSFRFTMHTEHHCLGVMFDQVGVFH